MNSSQLFSGRVFVCRERKYAIQNYKYKSLIERILKDAGITAITSSVIETDGSENFDCLILEQQSYKTQQNTGVTYGSGGIKTKSKATAETSNNKYQAKKIKLKFSFDSDERSLDRESLFLRENKSIFTDKYIASGNVKFGDKVKYLLTSVEEAETVSSCGRYVITENLPSLIFSLMAFSKTKCGTTFKEYSAKLLDEVDISNLPETFLESIDSNYNIKNSKQILDYFKSEIENCYDKEVMEKESVCHGNLSIENILFRSGRFKFINCSDCFMGNKLLDLSFMFLSAGFTKNQIRFCLNDYAKALNLKIEDVDREFDLCFKMATLIHFARLIHSYMVESLVFLGRNKTRILSLIDSFSRCYIFLEEFDLLPDYRPMLKQMFIDPVIKSQIDVTAVPSSVAQKDRITNNKKTKQPQVKANLVKDDTGKLFFDVSWESVNDYSDYFCYVVKPNGTIKTYESFTDTSFTYHNIDVIGDYGIGVKSIGDDNNEDSDFNIVKISVLDI